MPQDYGFDAVARAASLEMNRLWSPEYKAQAERELWLAVMEAQFRLGVLQITEEAIAAYRKVVARAEVDLSSIRAREMVTRHDVKARLEEFNALAGHQLAHLGMTGRDLDDNIELYQQRRALVLLADELAQLGQDAMAEDVLRLSRRVRFRGIVGAIGTGQDQLDLFEGDASKLNALNALVGRHLGFSLRNYLDSVGQVYPRSLDFEVASSLTATLSATRIPGPRRTPSPYLVLMRGYTGMLAELAGDQWAEGDVSCSSPRRVALPGLFLSASAHIQSL